jgi:hypothetical protein
MIIPSLGNNIFFLYKVFGIYSNKTGENIRLLYGGGEVFVRWDKNVKWWEIVIYSNSSDLAYEYYGRGEYNQAVVYDKDNLIQGWSEI